MTSSSSSSAVCVLEDFFFDEPPWLLLLFAVVVATALDVVVVGLVLLILSCNGSGTEVVGIVVVVEVVCDCWVCRRFVIGFFVVAALAFDVELFELVLSFSSLLVVELYCWLDVCGGSWLLELRIDGEQSEWPEFDSDLGSTSQSFELLRT